MEESTVIALSKTKILLLIAGACCFVALGYWMLQMNSAEIESQRWFNSPLLVHGIGIVNIFFFGACGLFGLKKLVDKRPGLVLSPSGILDNSSGISVGFIPWSEISGFGVWGFKNEKTLVINVVNPQKYIDVGGPIRRKLNKINFKLVGSPIAISSNSLKVNFSELYSICNAYFEKYGSST